MKVILLKGRNWFWRLKSSNGRSLSDSIPYKNRGDALESAQKIARRLATKVTIGSINVEGTISGN